MISRGNMVFGVGLGYRTAEFEAFGVRKLGVTHLVFRTHFLGMPLSNALASMRLISEELLPALHAAKPTPLEQIVC